MSIFPSYPLKTFGGRGGYARGSLKLSYRTKVYLYIGGHGITQKEINSFVSGGFNGGGRGTVGQHGFPAGSGGGSTDIRIGCKALSCRKMIAGGGGGAGGPNWENSGDLSFGGSGGGLIGTDGTGWIEIADGYQGIGATQNGPGIGGNDGNLRKAGDGELGKGGENTNPSMWQSSCGGGGGGLYGGGAGGAAGGGGGSGYLDKNLYSNNGISNVLSSGAATIKDLYGNSFSGNKGNGMIRITVLSRTRHAGTQCIQSKYSKGFLFTTVFVIASY